MKYLMIGGSHDGERIEMPEDFPSTVIMVVNPVLPKMSAYLGENHVERESYTARRIMCGAKRVETVFILSTIADEDAMLLLINRYPQRS